MERHCRALSRRYKDYSSHGGELIDSEPEVIEGEVEDENRTKESSEIIAVEEEETLEKPVRRPVRRKITRKRSKRS